MFHLFNKVYIDHEQHFNSRHDYMIAYSVAKPHPMTYLLNQDFDPIPSFEEDLASKYSGDIEKFWKVLLEKKQPFVVYADSDLYHQLQFQYWKSIFLKNEDKTIFELYLFFSKEYLVKSTMPYNHGDNHLGTTTELYQLNDFLTFKERYDSAPFINCLSEMNKSNVSFEYLLGDYFFDQNSIYMDAFMARLEKLSWKCWFSDIDALREDILGALYNIDHLIPQINVKNLGRAEMLEEIKKEPKLSWLIDPRFNKENIPYIKKNYNQTIFCSLAKDINHIWGYGFNRFKSDEQPLAFDQLLLTELLFKGDYLTILKKDMEKKFGSIFVSDKISDRANMFMTAFIYDMVLSKQLDRLEMFKLRQ